jgi:ribosome-associated translation inhibitor RaiA
MAIAIDVKTSFQHSDALDAFIRERITHALKPHAPRIRRVDIRLTDANGPRGGEADKVTTIDVLLNPRGELVTTGRAGDIYDSVTQAIAIARAAILRRLERRVSRSRKPARATWNSRNDAREGGVPR